jgi:hypothetical protein
VIRRHENDHKRKRGSTQLYTIVCHMFLIAQTNARLIKKKILALQRYSSLFLDVTEELSSNTWERKTDPPSLLQD